MTHPPPCRVAIVGFGPRGFGCLERLAIEVARRGRRGRALVVTAHDPRPHPGAGPPYDPAQPDCMLLNFSARHIDVWSGDNDLLPAGERPSFLEWLARDHGAWASGDAFAPRRLLGSYLWEASASLLAALPPGLTFRRVPGEVRSLERSDGSWSIRHDDPALDVEGVAEVMVATGHGTWSGDHRFESWGREIPVTPRTRRIFTVYPVAERLGRESVPDGAVVGLRGFALTAIDAALALTVGRGGRFEESGSTTPRYRSPGGAEPTLVPFSRSGLPPLAKPGAELARRSSELTAVWEPLRRAILDADDLTPESLRQLLEGAGALAITALGGRVSEGLPGGERSGPERPERGLDPAECLRTMERSVRVARGLLPPDEAWARGEAWRQAYPAVVSRAGAGGLATTAPAEFARLARSMERHAFGPPAANLSRMVALAAAGRIDLRALCAPGLGARQGRLVLHGDGPPIALDVLVNAVIAPPGVHEDRPLLLDLVRRGHASRAPGWDGVVVSPSAASIGRDGSATPGLSIVGRATEGWVVGNDTLSRTLHEHTRRWAERVVADAAHPDVRVDRIAAAVPR